MRESNQHPCASMDRSASASITCAVEVTILRLDNFITEHLYRSEHLAAVRRFADFIVQKNNRFLLFLVKQKISKAPLSFFAYVITRKRSANQRKKIQGCGFLLNWRPHAKIQLIWTKKKKRPKIRHRMVMPRRLQLF